MFVKYTVRTVCWFVVRFMTRDFFFILVDTSALELVCYCNYHHMLMLTAYVATVQCRLPGMQSLTT